VKIRLRQSGKKEKSVAVYLVAVHLGTHTRRIGLA
jgi:hypothetical protein